MKTTTLIFCLMLLLGLNIPSAQALPQYQLSIQNPSLIGTTYQFDLCIKRTGSTGFRLGNSQCILSFNTGAFTAPAVTRVPSSEQIGSGFFFDQVITGDQIWISLGGNGLYTGAADIATVGTGTRISTYRISGVAVPVLSAGLIWKNSPEIIRTGVSAIDNQNNYTDITDMSGSSHIGGGGEFATLSGFVFNDLNGDGVWGQPAEPGLNGWTITLNGPGGILTALTGTGTWPVGYYEFDNVVAGTYTISQTLQAGWSQTVQAASPVTLGTGQNLPNQNFGNFNGPAILGSVFEDANNNGQRDPGENGIVGWEVVAAKSGGSVSKTRVTNSSGQYSFTFQPDESGTWTISETPHVNWLQTFPTPTLQYSIAVQSGTYETGKDFGNFYASSVSGTVLTDVNGDSLAGPGDLQSAGWRVYLAKNGLPFQSTLTGNDGAYSFAGLIPATYTVTESLPSGWIQTQVLTGGGYEVVINSGGAVSTGKDFLNFQLGTASGIVYNDFNHDGVKDSTELGLANQVINVVSPAASYHAVSATDGRWTAAGLVAGSYSVTETVPSGVHLTEPQSGAYSISVSSGTVSANLRFGNSPARDTVKFRTMSYEDLAYCTNQNRKLGEAVIRKVDKCEFRLIAKNTAVLPVNGIAIYFRLGIVYPGDSSHPIIITPPPSKITYNPQRWILQVTWSDTIPLGEPVAVSAWVPKGRVQSARTCWLHDDIQIGPIIRLLATDFNLNALRLPMPNVANVRDETYKKIGFPTGCLIGISRSDASRYYGWVNLKTAKSMKSSFMERGLVHQMNSRGFDVLNTGRAFRGEMTSLSPRKQDNLLFADVATLKLNIAASALGILPPGLGELILNDGNNPLNGYTLRRITQHADSALTYWQFYPPGVYPNLDTTISKINKAFSGVMDTVSFGSNLVTKGVRMLKEVPFLRADAGVAPVVQEPGVAGAPELPAEFRLYQNYPNPFNPTTTISFDLPQDAVVTLKVYNILGQEVATLLNHEIMDGGVTQEAEFFAGNLPSGVYFYRINAEGLDDEGNLTSCVITQTKKMMLIK